MSILNNVKKNCIICKVGHTIEEVAKHYSITIIIASFIKEGADKESREAFKILIQEYRPKGYQK